MSRRKQARPIRHLEEDGAVIISALPNGDASASGSDHEASANGVDADADLALDAGECRRCHMEFTDVADLRVHAKECARKAMLLGLADEPASDADGDAMEDDDEEDEESLPAEDGVKRLEEVRRQRQDAENNNSGEGVDGETEDGGEGGDGFPFPAPAAPASHVTLEALQNTKVAVAQFAATTMANNGDNAAALQELAVLQSTLFTLQHQQVMQLSLIQQLQSQLSITLPKDEDSMNPASPPVPLPPAIALPAQLIAPKPSRSRSPTPVKLEAPVILTPSTQSIPSSHSQQQQHQQQQLQQLQQNASAGSNSSFKPLIGSGAASPPPAQMYMNSLQSMCSISSTLADTIITNNDPMPLNEPNTLDMLQKRAQEVLDNASQGLLANNLADELAFRKSGCKSLSPYDSKSGGRNEPFFKHRCRYCGKVFGSDSALQIHIRSHTGERPFKCNVCGSRFTTKGNLKVHFQRHTSKFPHIKMNPNPVPEHLDKYHPPLLAQMGQSISPGHSPHPHHPHSHHPPPPHPHHPFHQSGSFPATSIPLYRPPPPPHDLMTHHPPGLPHHLDQSAGKSLLAGHPIFSPRSSEQDVPENLSKAQSSHSSPPPPSEHSDRYKKEPLDDDHHSEDGVGGSGSGGAGGRLSPKQEPDTDHEPEEMDHDTEGCYDPSPYDECSLDSKYSDEDMMMMRENDSDIMDKNEDSLQEQPENLSSKSASANGQSVGQRLPASFPFPSQAASPASSTSSGSAHNAPTHGHGNHIPSHHDVDPSKDPAIYTNLLPRPGSNDNSWESLIEVTKTSETYKLQQLVDNIENKLTDPNQCVICNRVLSCKSALQMHYRTHTGERPFRCKICGRAFTTKGNLKTHMGVHRAKPPMRVLHQCPVCHKKFTNALVLQQHIRLHTGEPTDLTPEQIQAAEIKEYPHSPFSLPNSMNPFLAQGFHIPGMPIPPHGLHMSANSDYDDREGKEDYRSDFLEDDDSSNESGSPPMPTFSTSLAALENQVRTITTMASQLSASGLSSSGEDLCRNKTSTPTPNGARSPGGECPGSPTESEVACSPSPPPVVPLRIPRPPSPQRPTDASPAPGAAAHDSESNSSLGALDLTPRAAAATAAGPPPPPGVFAGFGLLPPGSMTSALSALTTSVLTSTAFSPIGMAVGPAAARPGNTTCNICFKTFACNSALEIHFRSHTKERPFKCTVCERGFSTKGNSAPLDAQPKRDCVCDQWRIQRGDSGPGAGAPDNLAASAVAVKNPKRRDRKRNGNDDSNRHKRGGSSGHKKYSSLPPLLCNPGYAAEWTPLLGNMKQHMLTHKIRDMPSHLFENIKPPHPPMLHHGDTNTSNDDTSSVHEDVRPPPPPPPPKIESPIMKMEIGMKRSPPEGESLLPIPKRQPSLPKHLCNVCNKNFSSSSALQIHMRTHTGDKPFRCTVCQKAFTTKGNLKVHMGTHMWSNGASRRGRRMSLDLPPIPMTPKDSEFLQRRPDLFYPYLPAPFLNGMQQKLNEISVIQSVNSNNIGGGGMTHPSSKYASLLGFGNYCMDKPVPADMHQQRSQTNSPCSDKPPSSVSSPPPPLSLSHRGSPPGRDLDEREPRGMWDLRYDRKPGIGNGDEPMDVSPSPPGHGASHPPPTPRGEGLAA